MDGAPPSLAAAAAAARAGGTSPQAAAQPKAEAAETPAKECVTPSRAAAPASSGVSASTPTQLGSLEHSLPSAGDLLSAATGAPTSEVRRRGRQS